MLYTIDSFIATHLAIELTNENWAHHYGNLLHLRLLWSFFLYKLSDSPFL